MIRKTDCIRIGTIISLAFFFWGCTEAPNQELEEARQVIEDARQAGAANSSPESFGQAQDFFQMAQKEIEAQENQLALFRDYDMAKELLDKAKMQALQARTAVKGEEKAKAKGEVQTAVAEAQAALEEAKTLLAMAPTGKDTSAALLAMEADLQSAEGMLAEISRGGNQQDYLKTKEEAQMVKDLATQVSRQVQQAIRKTK